MERLWDAIITLVDSNRLARLFGQTILSLLVLVLFFVGGRVLRATVRRVAGRTSRNANLPILLSNLVYVSLMAVAGITILSIYTGAGISSVLTLVGLVSLAISLSVQDVLKNFVSGVYLLLEQPFSIGDRIKVRDMEGKVENIEIRTTTLHTDDGVLVYIPNSIVFSEVVVNRTYYRQRLTTLRLNLTYTSVPDFTEVSDKIKTVLEQFEPAQVSTDPAIAILLETMSNNLLTARIEFWSPISAPAKTASDVILALSQVLPTAQLNGPVLAVPVTATVPPPPAPTPPPIPVVPS